ncbi:MAG: B-box zinc finger protein [Candidatus Lokiarchaeota archaeon]|nr:B-box zinc finger protein [Candidatus Lokiarchaeota archaeon]
MSERFMQGDICCFCQRNEKLAYFCENCGVSCCSDCLDIEKVETLVCDDCNSRYLDIKSTDKKENKKICKICGKENVIKLSQYIKTCPKCHSQNIINIYEKKEKLEQKFLELIKSSRLYIEPFRDVINKIYLLRQKVRKARDPPITCFHFPKMESKLLSLFKLVKYLEISLLERITTYFHYLASNEDYFFAIYQQPNSNIKVIEGILENLNKSHVSIKEFIDKNIDMMNNDINILNKNLKFINKITEYFSTYKRFINLAENEKPVYAIKSKLSNGSTNQDMMKKNKGFLFITNIDLSFVQIYGIIKKKQGLIFKAPVNDLLRIKEKGKILKKLYLEFSYGTYEFSLPNKSISRVIEYILLARNFDETTLYDEESAKKLDEIDIDLNKLNTFIEDGINSFFSIKCEQNYISNVKTEQEENNKNDYPYYHYDHPNIPPNRLHPSYCNPSEPIYPPMIPDSDTDIYPNNPNNPNNYQIIFQNNHDAPKSNLFKNRLYPNRFQNYDPRLLRKDLKQKEIDQEEKNILMKKLIQAQKFGQYNPEQRNRIIKDLINKDSIKNYPETIYPDPIKSNPFSDYNMNHLSELFNSENNPKEKLYNYDNEDFFENVDKNTKVMMDLKTQRFSIQEILDDLDKKFDRNRISERDYYRAFKHHKQELYMINKKIEQIKKKMEDDKNLREFKRKYENQYT